MAQAAGQAGSGLVSALARFGLDGGKTTVVAGEDADQVAAACQAAGGPPIAFQSPTYAVLTTTELPGDLTGAAPHSLGLASRTADLIVLRHGAPHQTALVAALREAYRVLRPGGAAVVADLDLDALMDGTALRYPSRMQYDLYPDLLVRESRRHLDRSQVGVEMVRAGFQAVAAYPIDETLAELPPDQYWELVRELRRLLPRFLLDGKASEREPWHVTRGLKPLD